MKWAATFFAMAALVGCSTAPVSYTTSSRDLQNSSIYTVRSDATNARTKLAERRKMLAAASAADDIELLKREIVELETRLASLEKSIAEQESAISRPSTYTPTGSGTVYTGSRGGRYTITPSGNKSYTRRK